MRLLGYVLSILGILTVIVANMSVSSQVINAIMSFLAGIAQIVLRYASSQGLTIGGLVVLIIGLVLILFSYRR